MKKNTVDDVWRFVDKRSPDECWNWTAGLSGGGYAQFAIAGRLYQAHRVAYASANPGAIELRGPKDRSAYGVLLHSCDNPKCCNPAHLSVGTQKSNMEDAVKKGRAPTNKGEKNPSAILNMESAKVIKQRFDNGETRASIARSLGLSWSCIDMVAREARWTNA
jgi:hypothetical protein